MMVKPTTPAFVIMRCTVGSTVHGLALDGTDDRDEMGVAIEPTGSITGLGTWEHHVERTQPEGVRSGPGDLDLVIYGLRKWMRLATAGNPTVLIPLFVSSVDHQVCRPEWNLIRHNRKLILSRRAASAFQGYMLQQKLRLLGVRGQKRVKRPELEERFGYDTKYAMHALRLGYQGIELLSSGKMTLPMREPEREACMAVRRGLVNKGTAIQMIEAVEAQLADVARKTSLPEKPDIPAINHLLHDIYMRHFQSPPPPTVAAPEEIAT